MQLGKAKSVIIDEILYRKNKTKFKNGLKTKVYECNNCGNLTGKAKDLINSFRSV